MEGHNGYSNQSEKTPPVQGKFILLPAINAYRGMELYLHPFLISCQMEVSNQLLVPLAFLSEKEGH